MHHSYAPMPRKAELMTALREVGHKLDVAKAPAEMRALITARRRITALLQARAPAPLRIFRP